MKLSVWLGFSLCLLLLLAELLCERLWLEPVAVELLFETFEDRLCYDTVFRLPEDVKPAVHERARRLGAKRADSGRASL